MGLLLTPPAAMALEFHCEAFGETREVRVDIPGKEHLCDVILTRQPGGQQSVAWYARNDTLYCSARAYEMRDKYEQKWGYTCETKPEVDGIDQLSSTQRRIFDARLKANMEMGRNATPAYKILGVRAVASTPLDKQPAKVAIQFLSDKGDFTEVVDDQVQSWNVTNTIEQFSEFVTSDVPVTSALMHSISDAGAIEIHTQLSDNDGKVCFGKQLFTPTDNSAKAASTHRFSCQPDTMQKNALNKTASSGTDTTSQ